MNARKQALTSFVFGCLLALAYHGGVAASSFPGGAGGVTSAGLDSVLGSTRGAVAYRGASGWTSLVPGTAGDVLTSNGSGADPSYQTPGGGSLNGITNSTPGILIWSTGSGAVDQLTGPTDQPFRFAGGSATGSNTAGVSAYVAAGRGTGNASSGHVVATTGWPAASSSTLQSETQRIFVSGGRKTLSDNVSATYAKVACPTGAAVSGTVFYSVRLTAAGGYQCVSGIHHFAGVNPSGTVTVDGIGSSGAEASSGGSVNSVTVQTTAGTNEINLGITFDTSLASPTITMSFTLIANTPDVTVTPQ